jgi:membrane protease YdiL (CAAX protease family)
MSNKLQTLYYYAEFVVLFLVIPVILYFTAKGSSIFLGLWVFLLICYALIRKQDAPYLWDTSAITWKNLKPILLRFALSAVALTGFLWWYEPERLFQFMLTMPENWAMVMFLYPILSIFPQEYIYRHFFFLRYKHIFPDMHHMVAASGVAFGIAHILLYNPIAVTLSMIGGLFFAYTYAKTRSLMLVMIEHALYGNFIFTVGLGWYFWAGAVR